uniref:Short-chain dehydrogenase/reductase n=1 Tax=uncultured prokaryote TaxID=198431 RepID=H5SKC3_9ZZZZ|nr:short-chain dehydrogenase/reductase [uncultured prokaryote]
MPINLDAIGKRIGPMTTQYSWKEAVLYALGVGAGFDELEYVYENRLKIIPSFAVPLAYPFFAEVVARSGINLAGLLHAEQETIFHAPLSPEGDTLTTEGRITRVYDRGEGKGAFVIAEAVTTGSDGRRRFTHIMTLFGRLDGGFGGEPPPKEEFVFPDRPPDFVEEQCPSRDQPLIYRLSGDTFALHVDPDFARASGFEGPIMHGLCTHGFACRAVVKHLFPGEPERMSRFRVRFSRPLYPGVPIRTEIWKLEEGKAVFRTVNAQTGEVVLDRGVVEWVSREEAARRARGEIRFDGRVAIVTGAGRGLGRAYALELARRGARVVVNDPGVSRDGSGEITSAVADEVVAEIRALGGEAVANYDSVATPEGGERIVQTALEAFGRVDILINNAGILRDKSFANMTPEMWEAVLSVHLDGAYNVTRPAFLRMREQGYGRIVFTTSAAGLFGNFGQTNYSAAKMGLVGLMNTLKLEGEKYGIKVNTVAPLATTRLTEDVFPPEVQEQLKPEYVVPLVVYLCSEECPVSGGVYTAGGGVYGRAVVVSAPGVRLDGDRIPTPEDIAARWQEIISLAGAKPYPNANAQILEMLSPPAAPAPAPAAPAAGLSAPAAPAGAPTTVAEVFARMPEFFRPEKAAGVDVVFQFRISGPGGGDWYVVVKEGTCTVSPGVHEKPTTTLKMADEDFLALVAGKLPAMQAFTTGKLKIEGDLMKSQLVQKLFRF